MLSDITLYNNARFRKTDETTDARFRKTDKTIVLEKQGSVKLL